MYFRVVFSSKEILSLFSMHVHIVQDDLLQFKLNIRIGKKGDLNDFEHAVVVGDGLV